jgi:hypothetical protein
MTGKKPLQSIRDSVAVGAFVDPPAEVDKIITDVEKLRQETDIKTQISAGLGND